ncbi:APH(3') family aminoglycoside O-phosphotransferase [Marinactinospora rubrisoli]|uniref:APH(3') family aminoglycoside O-phosphotransferase n=1 Tax=Marinactinospora rubrisoli TaxID=2715399 RepID=A0ABW2KPH2_9ACTN
MESALRTLRRRHPFHSWQRVTAGASGAQVWRFSRRRTRYVKLDTDHAALAAEAERSAWLAEVGIGAPEVLEFDGRDGVYWLVSTAVPGRSLAQPWPAHHRAPVVAALARFARHLHDLPIADCPFDRRLAVTVPEAESRVAAGLVDPGDFDAERRGRTPEDLLAELHAGVPESEDLVVCHGDMCLPNVLVDPATLEWTGVVDVGRLGVADRHTDLALAGRSLADTDLNPAFGAPFARAFLEHYGGHLVSEERLAFFRLLDEFF